MLIRKLKHAAVTVPLHVRELRLRAVRSAVARHPSLHVRALGLVCFVCFFNVFINEIKLPHRGLFRALHSSVNTAELKITE